MPGKGEPVLDAPELELHDDLEAAPARRPLERQPSLLQSAPLLSRVTWSWVGALLRRGAERPLEADDLEPFPAEDSADAVRARLDEAWRHERAAGSASRRPHFGRAVGRAFGWPLLRVGLWLLLYSAAKIAQPVLLREIIVFVGDGGDGRPAWEGYALALGLGTAGLLTTVVHHQYFFACNREALRARTAVSAVLYDKGLRLRAATSQGVTAGQSLNLVANDAQRFDDVAPYVNYVWNAPLEAAVCLALIWREVGPAALAGLASLLLVIPLQSVFAGRFAQIRKLTLRHTDRRVKAMGELLAGAQVMKMYNWEAPLDRVVDSEREQEHAQMRRAATYRGVNLGLYTSSTAVAALATFAVYAEVMGRDLDPATVFTTLALFNVIRVPLILFLPMAIEKLSDLRIALGRMDRFMQLGGGGGADEAAAAPPPSTAKAHGDGGVPRGAIEVRDATFRWAPGAEPALRGVTLDVRPGELLAVVGPVAAGKSSLLAALLGEMEGGPARVGGSVAYAPQRAWVFADTVRNNVLFGRAMDGARYRRVLEACQLRHDLALLEHGDGTAVGERGVTLSGGQQARVSLARAVYAGADVTLLDDPLSAVDALVARRIFDGVLGPRGLLRGTTRVLVTHQTQFLGEVDRVAVLAADGSLAALGSLAELRASGFDMASLHLEEDEEEGVDEEEGDGDDDGGQDASGEDEPASRRRLCSERSEASETSGAPGHHHHQRRRRRRRSSASTSRSQSVAASKEGAAAGSFEKETRERGTVAWAVYREFLFGGSSSCVVAAAVLLMVATQVVAIGADWWLSRWSAADAASGEQDRAYWLPVYGALVAGALVLGVVRAVWLLLLALSSSRTLHRRMFQGVLYSPMRFFQTNPAGRVLNRFTKDQSIVDELLPVTLLDFCLGVLMVVSSLLVVLAVTPWVALLLAPGTWAFFRVRAHYLVSSRELKRLDALARSPVYAHFAATQHGVAVVRAYRAGPRFSAEFRERLDGSTLAFFNFLVAQRWVGFRLDALAAGLVYAAGLLAVASRGQASASSVGLSLSYSVMLAALLQWVVRQSAELEAQMTATERILEYGRLPPEGERRAPPERRPPPGWPSRGALEARNLELRYAPGADPVLRGLSFRVPAHAKLGVVGRTGAGKSSLFSAFFRLVEASGGEIRIDGVDVSRVGLADLRERLSIIPQSPLLFSGTVRHNLDPFGTAGGDLRLWDALDAVQLGGAVRALDGGLDAQMSEGGGNFSVGEAQLLCVARALLRDSPVLFVDEATASVDKGTDRVIQRVLAERFASRTVVTIAHRLGTVIESDLILVLDAGRVAQFGPPDELLREPRGILRDMAAKAGLVLPAADPLPEQREV